MPELRHTLSKAEKVCSKTDIARLVRTGAYRSVGCIRFAVVPSPSGISRILVSVPKRNFKRAVKRNLLKRRIREAYRLNKALIGSPSDILFIYTEREVLPFGVIEQAVRSALGSLEA